MSLSEFGEKLELKSEVEIAADRARVWQALFDASTHQLWNPFWSNLRGTIAKTERVELEVNLPGSKSMRTKRMITELEQDAWLLWSGGYGWGLLLRSEQSFRLAETGGSATRLTVSETLRGPGVTGQRSPSLAIVRGQALMNQALKHFVEHGHQRQRP
jgi:hypothetical protein